MFVFLRTFLIFIALTSQLFTESSEPEDDPASRNLPEYTYVSLGATCHTAIALRDIGFRTEAYPFDWLISTHHENFIFVLDDDFKYFTDAGCFSENQGIPCHNNNYYKIGFPHDFDTTNATADQILEQWNVFKDKYDRRIERFRNLRKYTGKVFFVRAFWGSTLEGANGEFSQNTKRAQDLRDALDRYFPSLDFTLVILSYPDLNIPVMQKIKGVVELRIGRSYDDLKTGLEKLKKSK